MFRAVFFDKDGTLIEDVPYNIKPDLIRLKRGAGGIVKTVKDAGFKVFVVSNQSGIARGYFKVEELKDVWRKLEKLCEVEFDGFYFCPHLVNGTVAEFGIDCDCRKPKSGMLKQAAREHNLDLRKSWMIGDTLNDAQAGNDANCQTIFIHNSKTGDDKLIFNEFNEPRFIVESLDEAKQIIIKNK
ncbi:MAG: HAD family hydrolase [Pyrinomonadaceae bacterium]|nr:HAD family hydrolase [Pyrinomonadaceae bacterium]